MSEFVTGRYRHFKGGLYHAIGTATDSETLAEMVIYRAEVLEGLWVRPRHMFEEIVEIEGATVSRFTLLAEPEA
ncbi:MULTISPECIES: DUF1653 domain-containing protein [Subtercola]|uniref:DUF1653 domain-containing protein n=1 Tax=Subtercola vilae TaxID=2056433 RepID=A0A4T2C6L3_9MICO|nr:MULTISPECIES: DUF1653 domain-containing protein [Subtercola]MEA9984852.1 DUF1653 domain-containing protein [Subtercola sp. RTI3]TIH39877.1 DUF1653 domain-containing protein [Subtercola vilae]